MIIINNRDTNKQALKSGSWYSLTSIIIRSTSLLTTPIFSRMLLTSDYGIASNFMAWVNIFYIFTGLGLTYSIGNAKIDYPSKLDKYIASIQVLTFIVGMIVLLLSIFFQNILSEMLNLDKSLIIFMFLYLIFYSPVILIQEVNKFKFKYKENIFIAIFSTLGAIILCLILIQVFNEKKYIGRILGLTLPLMGMGIIYLIKIIKQGYSKEIVTFWRYGLKIGLPMIPHALSMVVLGQIDRIMILKIIGSSEAGIYSFGYTYAILLSLISNSVLQAFIPWLYLKYKEGDFASIIKTNKLMTYAMCLLTFILITFAPEILKILGPIDYWEAKWLIAPIAIGTLFQYVYSCYSSIELYYKKTNMIAIGSVFSAIINIVLNIILIRKYGYIAAAYTTLICYLLLAIYHRNLYKKITNNKIYDDVYIWILTFITLILSFLIMNMYNNVLQRYCFFVFVMSIAFFIEKKNIKNFLILIKK